MKSNSISKLIKTVAPDWAKKICKILFRYQNVIILPDKPSYAEDGLATIHNADFIQDPEFSRAYSLGLQTGSWAGVRWRAHVYSWFALQAFQLEGDFVECGVNRGGFARMVFDYTPLSTQLRNSIFWIPIVDLQRTLLIRVSYGLGSLQHMTIVNAMKKSFIHFLLFPML